jgi:hypothetical protein
MRTLWVLVILLAPASCWGCSTAASYQKMEGGWRSIHSPYNIPRGTTQDVAL